MALIYPARVHLSAMAPRAATLTIPPFTGDHQNMTQWLRYRAADKGNQLLCACSFDRPCKSSPSSRAIWPRCRRRIYSMPIARQVRGQLARRWFCWGRFGVCFATGFFAAFSAVAAGSATVLASSFRNTVLRREGSSVTLLVTCSHSAVSSAGGWPGFDGGRRDGLSLR